MHSAIASLGNLARITGSSTTLLTSSDDRVVEPESVLRIILLLQCSELLLPPCFVPVHLLHCLLPVRVIDVGGERTLWFPRVEQSASLIGVLCRDGVQNVRRCVDGGKGAVRTVSQDRSRTTKGDERKDVVTAMWVCCARCINRLHLVYRIVL